MVIAHTYAHAKERERKRDAANVDFFFILQSTYCVLFYLLSFLVFFLVFFSLLTSLPQTT